MTVADFILGNVVLIVKFQFLRGSAVELALLTALLVSIFLRLATT